jgi:ubiquitin-conjugating enzyme E2 Q
MSSTDPRPAQLEAGMSRDYGIGEAIDAYIRACRVHGWTAPASFSEMAQGGASSSGY